MKVNLEQLHRDILSHLDERGLVTFRSFPRGPELGADAVYWDTEAHPDYREFIAAAEAIGAKLVTVYAREFNTDVLDDALDNLAGSRMDRDERRELEAQLKTYRRYEGKICQVEVSFAHGRRTYLFDRQADWYDEMNEVIAQTEDSYSTPAPEPSTRNPLGGFFSNN